MAVFEPIVTWTLPVLAVCLVPMFIAVAMIYLWRRWFVNRNRRSPLTTELLRSPGYGLREQIEDMSFDIVAILMATALTPLMLYALHLSSILNKPADAPISKTWTYRSEPFSSFTW
jgi:hypothetical protein